MILFAFKYNRQNMVFSFKSIIQANLFIYFFDFSFA